jgi:alpha-glucosidase
MNARSVTVFFFMLIIPVACYDKDDLILRSPDGELSLKLDYDKTEGGLTYSVTSRGTEIVTKSRIGIVTENVDFGSGLKIKKINNYVIDEHYTLPQGKTSQYHNRANEKAVTVSRKRNRMTIRFRVYDDGIAFRYEIPGKGKTVITGEHSEVALAGTSMTFWGQNHPNRYGYESALGQIDGESISIPVLAELNNLRHFILISQAATDGNYIQPHFSRAGNIFRYTFPVDQEKTGPVLSTLPFVSPWRMAIVSPDVPRIIIESNLVENLNPPTRKEFFNDDGSFKEWLKPGNVMWDYIAKDSDKPRMWIDAAAEMGWDYYMADAGFAGRWGGVDSVPGIVKYAEKKGVSIIGWAHTREFDSLEKAARTMKRYADWGLKGAKIDFFDQNTLSENPRDWKDYQDTQQSLRMRDWIFDLAIKNNFLIELHGNTMPTGERRQYPNLMTLEGVDGMERRTKPAANDLTIPFTRNVMGPVSYTVIHFERCPGTHAYQLAMPVVYEAGLKIYAEHGKKLIEWPGRELIADIPAAWDETRYIDGYPASHIIIARRSEKDWYLGAMTDSSRTVSVPLNFLEDGVDYNALIFSDSTHVLMKREQIPVNKKTVLSVKVLQRGGFAIRIKPLPAE